MVRVRNRNMAIAQDAMKLYEREMNKFLNSAQPMEPSEIEREVERRYGRNRKLVEISKDARKARNDISHNPVKDISPRLARRCVNTTISALYEIGAEHSVAEGMRLKTQLAAPDSSRGKRDSSKRAAGAKPSSRRHSTSEPSNDPAGEWIEGAARFTTLTIGKTTEYLRKKLLEETPLEIGAPTAVAGAYLGYEITRWNEPSITAGFTMMPVILILWITACLVWTKLTSGRFPAETGRRMLNVLPAGALVAMLSAATVFAVKVFS